MIDKAQQLTLDLPHRPALGREDFLVTASNAAAVALVDQWPAWPSYGAIIVGPPGSGKTHLVEVWREKSHAQICNSTNLAIEAIPALLASGRLAIDIVTASPIPERAVFHLLNYAKQENCNLLLVLYNNFSDAN